MNMDILQGRWKEVKGSIKHWWGLITDDDLNYIEGNWDKLIGKLQERYGYSRDQAEKEVNDFLSMPDDRRRRRTA